MASRSGCSCFFFVFFFIVSLIHWFHAQAVSLPSTFLLPVTKDASSLQYGPVAILRVPSPLSSISAAPSSGPPTMT
ncbi:hypothetical protein CDL15_Pgr022976 [Punica granatum]|uniref:Uncharacterized protein n=1 Tax=Punica granatum TaxID=22663 RepID=A0A218X3S0_PUNGR|nr:hypothetical protein CDL15_Pgr022976 [Punica granatum]